MNIDFLIIGQGLAGSLLAWELMQRDCTIMIVDNAKVNASQIAAGLINPITGMRFVKSAQVETFLPIAKNYYAHLSKAFHKTFYVEKPMLRIFRNHEELKSCEKRLTQQDYQAYLDKGIEPAHPTGLVASPYGYIEQKQTGYLATQPLLSHLEDYFISRSCYQKIDFPYQEIQLSPRLRWRDIRPKKIIFCEGYLAKVNPWFSWLPMQGVKGEILTLGHQIDLPNKILNNGHWLIPFDKQNIRMGTSFERNWQSTETSESVRQILFEACKALLPSVEFDLIKQEAGIRPCTPDRHPFIGYHPKYPQLVIFNGFGAKGSLQIPWYAQHFVESLLNHTPLLDSANIIRYETFFTG